MGSKVQFLVDFEDTEVDHQCGMKLWFKDFEGGGGIVRKSDVIRDAIFGQTQQDIRDIAQMGETRLTPPALMAMVQGILAQLSPDDKQNTQLMEVMYRRLGWLVAYALFIEPDIRKLFAEKPFDPPFMVDYDPLYVMTNPSRILRSLSTKELVYEECVPMPLGLTNKFWLESWKYHPRLHIGMRAVHDTTQEEVKIGRIRGLSMGYYSLGDGHLHHPYVYGYWNKNTDEWRSSLAYAKDESGSEGQGWSLRPIWENPEGIVVWVQKCGREVAERQFPLSPVITLDNPLVANWLSWQTNRARDIGKNKDVSVRNFYQRNVTFPRVGASCRPPTGQPCPYLEGCWDPAIKDRPLVSNIFQMRYIRREKPAEDSGQEAMVH